MSRYVKTIKSTFIIFLITAFLLELAAFAVLKIFSSQTNSSSSKSRPLELYDGQSAVITPNKTRVLPLKKEYKQQWNAKEFSVSIKTNTRGMRENKNASNAQTDIAFFGDSFTFGHGVEVNERFSNVFANYHPNLNVLNFAYLSGFQPEHYEYFIKNNPDLQPIHAIIGLYIGNDLGADIDETYYNRTENKLTIPHRMLSKQGNMINAPKIYKYPINLLINYSNTIKLFVKVINKTWYRSILFEAEKIPNQPNSVALELAQTDLSKNRGIIALKEIRKLLTARGTQLTVLLIPQNFFFRTQGNLHINEALKSKIKEVVAHKNLYSAIKTELELLNIDYLDPKSILNSDCYYKVDSHWNKLGHQIIGEALAKHVTVKK